MRCMIDDHSWCVAWTVGRHGDIDTAFVHLHVYVDPTILSYKMCLDMKYNEIQFSCVPPLKIFSEIFRNEIEIFRKKIHIITFRT